MWWTVGGKIECCFNKVNVNVSILGSDHYRIGGFTGTYAGQMSNIYNTGNLMIEKVQEGAVAVHVGGLVGQLEDTSISKIGYSIR